MCGSGATGRGRGRRPRRPLGSGRRAAAGRLLLLGPVACLVLAACGSTAAPPLDSSVVARAIGRSILDQRHIHTNVDCPDDVPVQDAFSFTCQAALEVGRYLVRVTEIDGRGHVRWNTRAPLAVLDMKIVRAAIERTLHHERRVRSYVACPHQVLLQKGLTFICTATVPHATSRLQAGQYVFDVTEVDRDGDVRYVAR